MMFQMIYFNMYRQQLLTSLHPQIKDSEDNPEDFQHGRDIIRYVVGYII
jgi:hypothetical protein